MKSFLSSVFIFILLCAAWAALFFAQLGKPTIDSEFMHSSYLKKEAAAATSTGPRIMVLGGSSFLFGLRSDLLASAWGVPVINHAMAASLGVDYLLQRNERILRAGDTVLLGMEYHHFMPETPIHTDVYLDFIVSRDESYFRELPLPQRLELITKISPDRLLTGLRGEPFRTSHIYDASNVSATGDIVLSLEHAKAGFEKSGSSLVRSGDFILNSSALNKDATALITKYISRLKDKGVCVIAIPAPILFNENYLAPTYAEFKQNIRNFYTSQNVPFVGRWDTHMFSEEFALDTIYHVNQRGSVARTEKIMNDIGADVTQHCH